MRYPQKQKGKTENTNSNTDRKTITLLTQEISLSINKNS
jgi:hypothetical protein